MSEEMFSKFQPFKRWEHCPSSNRGGNQGRITGFQSYFYDLSDQYCHISTIQVLSNVVLVGDGRKHLSALLTLRFVIFLKLSIFPLLIIISFTELWPTPQGNQTRSSPKWWFILDLEFVRLNVSFLLRCKTGWSRLAAVQPVSGRFWTRIAPRCHKLPLLLIWHFLHHFDVAMAKVRAALVNAIEAANCKAVSRANKVVAIINISCWQSSGFQVQKFALLPTDFSISTGELTPTLKVTF